MRNITGLMISTQLIPNSIEIYGKEMHQLIVVASNEREDILTTVGFDSTQECRDYCEMIRASLGLPEDAVDIDFNDFPPLTLVK